MSSFNIHAQGLFRILILWVLSVNKIFIKHPQFFPIVLTCLKIAGAKAPIASVLNTPLWSNAIAIQLIFFLLFLF